MKSGENYNAKVSLHSSLEEKRKKVLHFFLLFFLFKTNKQIHIWSFPSLLGRNRPGRAGNCTITFILCSLFKKKSKSVIIRLDKLLSIYGDNIKLWLSLCLWFESSKCLYCSCLQWKINQKWLKLGSLHLNGRTCSLNFMQKWRFASGVGGFGHVVEGKARYHQEIIHASQKQHTGVNCTM